MKKIISLFLVLLFVPCMVLAVDDETIKEYEQDIVEAYGEAVGFDNNQDAGYETEIRKSDVEYVNEKTGYKVVISDGASLIGADKMKELIDDMIPLTKYGHIIFNSISYNHNYSTARYASEYYHSRFGTQSGTLFLIDMANREIYIFSDGENYKTITSSKAYLITDNTYKKATAGLYYDCAKEAYKEIFDLLEGRKIMEPMRHVTNALISIIIGFFGTFLFMINKTKIPVATDKQLLAYSNVSFKAGDVSIIKTGTSKKYNPPSSSSGGGSSGGGSSGGGGGGSSGGGGGHSF